MTYLHEPVFFPFSSDVYRGQHLTFPVPFLADWFLFYINPLPSKQSFIDRRRSMTSTRASSAMTRVSVVFLASKERSGYKYSEMREILRGRQSSSLRKSLRKRRTCGRRCCWPTLGHRVRDLRWSCFGLDSQWKRWWFFLRGRVGQLRGVAHVFVGGREHGRGPERFKRFIQWRWVPDRE